MARHRPRAANPPNNQQPMRSRRGAAIEADEYGTDPWANGSGGVAQRPRAKSSRTAEVPVTIKQDEPEDGVAIPTPIAHTCWKIISPDGHEQLFYEPISGFKHLWSGLPAGLSQQDPCFAASPKDQPTTTPVSGRTLDEPKTQHNPRKRTRSSGRRLRSRHAAQHSSDNEDDGEYRDVRIPIEQSYTFYIGDIAELEKFFRRRLDELTMKPLRPIVTAWIKQLEPKRLSRYGPYHKQLPKNLPPECSPPWWPRDVSYEEPSHLDKAGLLTLAVDMMLQHRIIDKEKRKGSWVAKLRQAAQYAVETTPPDQFSSSKGSGFSEMMRSRALEEILPTLFETAQLYENHFASHGHYEGSGIPDPDKGKRVTWQPLMRPARPPVAPRKRPRTSKTGPTPRSEINTDASGEETKVDDSVTSSYPCGERLAPSQIDAQKKSESTEVQQQALASNRGAAAPPLHTCPWSTTTTPNVSFGQPMYEPFPGEKMDLDVKIAACAPPHDHTCVNGSHPMQYLDSHPGYNQHSIQLQQDGCALPSASQPVFNSSSGSAYHHPFPHCDGPFAHPVEHATFHDDTCYPHGYEMYGPSSAHPLQFFHEIADEGSMSCQAAASQY